MNLNASLHFIISISLDYEEAVSDQPTKERWTDNLFMSSGFRVDIVAYDDVAREFGKELEEADDKNILFIAEQLRFSDDQVNFFCYFQNI